MKQEALKFGRSLEMATRSLKPAVSKEQLEKGPEITAPHVPGSQVTGSGSTGSPVTGSPILVHKSTSSTTDAKSKSSSLPPTTSAKDRNGQLNRRSDPRLFLAEKSHSIDAKVEFKEPAVSRPSTRKQVVVVKAEMPSSSKCLPAEGSKSAINGDRVAAGKPQCSNGKSGSSKRSKSVDSGALDDRDLKKKADVLRIQKSAARANFFSSLTTPPTSPEEEKRSVTSPIGARAMDYTVRISPIRVTVSGETKYTVTPSSGSSSQRSEGSQQRSEGSQQRSEDSQQPESSQHPEASTSGAKPTFLPVFSRKEKPAENKSATPSPTTPSYVITPGGSKASCIPRISPQKSPPGASVQNRDINNVPKTSSSTSSKDSVSTNGSSSAKPLTSASKVSEKSERKSATDMGVECKQPRRAPPPPPPRKSSRPHPSSSTVLPGPLSPVRMDTDSPDSSVVTGHLMGSSHNVGTLTSTPKTTAPSKPTTKFEKDLAGGRSASSSGNADRKKSEKTDSQSAKSDKAETPVEKSDEMDAPLTKSSESSDGGGKSSSEVQREERESSSESTTSSSSLDSQQGTVVLRCTSGARPSKKPKPPPPARRSSLPLGNNPPVEKMSSSGRSKVNGRRESEGDLG